jgi:hypothetical protein
MIPPFPVRQGVYGASERCSPEIVAGIHGVQDQTGLHLVAVELHLQDTTEACESYIKAFLCYYIFRRSDQNDGCNSI